jgi:DNA recombination-mediator protein A
MLRGITISGARSTSHLPNSTYVDLFEQYVEPFVSPDVRFYLGGATGIDTLALRWLAENGPPQITVAVPCTLDDQPPDARAAIVEVLKTRDEAELVELRRSAHPDADAYHYRNRWMVDRSELLIAFPHGDHEGSGTQYTIEYARTVNKARLVVPI